jgi:hypothetical protein
LVILDLAPNDRVACCERAEAFRPVERRGGIVTCDGEPTVVVEYSPFVCVAGEEPSWCFDSRVVFCVVSAERERCHSLRGQPRRPWRLPSTPAAGASGSATNITQ